MTKDLIINDEIIKGQPLAIEKHIKMELANQILQMSGNDYENVTNNMRIFADVLEIIEEHIKDDIITLKYNPMGSWYLAEEKRTCSECHKEMTKGYCIENGEAYYCSDECLHKNMTQEEYLELYDNGNGDSYYTEWED